MSWNAEELTVELERLKHDLSQEVINGHIESMPCRVSACIAARADIISY